MRYASALLSLATLFVMSTPAPAQQEPHPPEGRVLLTHCVGEQGRYYDTCHEEGLGTPIVDPLSGETSPEVFLVGSDGHEERLTDNDVDEFAAVPSPDGRRVALSLGHHEQCRLYVMKIATAALLPVTPDADFVCPIATSWSPNGEWIVFSAFVHDGPSDLYKVRRDGTGLRLLTDYHSEGQDAFYGQWVKGKRIVFYQSLFNGRDGIFWIRPNGHDKRLLIQVKSIVDLSGSPNRRSIAYIVRDGEGKHRGEVFTARTDGTGIRRHTDNRLDEAGLSWSPDGKKLAFFAGDDTDARSFRLQAMDLESGAVRKFDMPKGLTEPSPWATWWSPSGRYIAFGGSNGSDRAIFAADYRTGALKQIVAFRPVLSLLAWLR